MNASPLPASVASLRSSLSLLESSISILGEGVQDFPRLSHVLQTTRHFEVISESHLVDAQEQVRAEIEPEVASLLERVESYLDRLARRERGLIARAELLQGRLSGSDSADFAARRGADDRAPGGKGKSVAKEVTAKTMDKALDPKAEERLKALRQKKERLAYAVERLSLQTQQRERQLRRSMAG